MSYIRDTQNELAKLRTLDRLSPPKLAGVAEAAKARADLFEAHRRAERDAREALLFAVSMERDLGTPWAEIERAAGITRQAIHALGR